MARVIEYGPNVRFSDGATFHIHAEGCQHTTRLPYSRIRLNSDQGGYVSEVSSREEIITGIYPPEDFGYDVATELDDYAADITIFPCTGL